MDIVKRAIIKQGSAWKGGPRVIRGRDGLLANLIPFDSQGAMWARRFPGNPSRGIELLDPMTGPYGRFEGDSYRRRIMGLYKPLYVVWSYQTPIAWVTWAGSIVVPDEKYSVTTTHHQGLCDTYMGVGTVWSEQDQCNISWTTQAVRDAEKWEWV